MDRTFYVLMAFFLVGAGCGKSGSNDNLAHRCERALAKVSLDELYSAPGAKGKPSAGEQAIIDGVRKASQAKCEAEGLTKEQAACFENVKDVRTLFEAADCPAIVAKKPSWLRVPPPEMRRKVIDRMKAKKAAETD